MGKKYEKRLTLSQKNCLIYTVFQTEQAWILAICKLQP